MSPHGLPNLWTALLDFVGKGMLGGREKQVRVRGVPQTGRKDLATRGAAWQLVTWSMRENGAPYDVQPPENQEVDDASRSGELFLLKFGFMNAGNDAFDIGPVF